MRLGFFLPRQDRDAGGGYTITNDVLAGLTGTHRDHEFVALGYGSRPGAVPHEMEYLDLRRSPLQDLRRRAARRARAALDGPSLPDATAAKRARRAGLRMVLSAGPWAPIVDVPYVLTVWDLQHRLQPWYPEVSSNGEWRHRERLYQSVLPRAARIIVGTQTGQQEVATFYNIPEHRIVILPHPTPTFALEDDVAPSDAVLRRYDLREGEFVLYPAQFWPHKNHVTLLRALRRLRDNGWPLRAVLVGADKGNLGHVLATAHSLGVVDQVLLPGFVDREELVALYRAAFALTYMSAFGPENLPPLEAFALGCPVIASRVSGAEEQLADAAMLVDTFDDNELANVLLRLRGDERLQATLRSRGLQRARSFSVGDFVSGLLDQVEAMAPQLDTSI